MPTADCFKKKYCKVILACIVVVFIADESWALSRVEFTPSINLRQEYDDNLNLSNQNAESDSITTASFSVNANYLSEKDELSISYTPAIVSYKKHNENNTIRHSASGLYAHKYSKKLAF